MKKLRKRGAKKFKSTRKSLSISEEERVRQNELLFTNSFTFDPISASNTTSSRSIDAFLEESRRRRERDRMSRESTRRQSSLQEEVGTLTQEMANRVRFEQRARRVSRQRWGTHAVWHPPVNFGNLDVDTIDHTESILESRYTDQELELDSDSEPTPSRTFWNRVRNPFSI